jgi:hypothetical protein
LMTDSRRERERARRQCGIGNRRAHPAIAPGTPDLSGWTLQDETFCRMNAAVRTLSRFQAGAVPGCTRQAERVRQSGGERLAGSATG